MTFYVNCTVDFTVKYIKGTVNIVADALSRIDISSEELKNLNNEICNSVYITTRTQTK